MKRVHLLVVVPLVFSYVFGQARVPALYAKPNSLMHLSSSIPDTRWEFSTSPWGNWLLALKKMGANVVQSGTPDSIHVVLFYKSDTSMAVTLCTLYPESPGSLNANLLGGVRSGAWSIFQDTIWFNLYGSTINTREYPGDPFNGEVFYLYVGDICGVKIPGLEYTPCDMAQFTGLRKQGRQATPAGTVAACPNPTGAELIIAFEMPIDNVAAINVYDAEGRLLRSLLQRPMKAGRHSIRWDCRDNMGKRLPSGQYFYQLVSGDFISPRGALTIAK